jgi:hypothetical protein
MSRHVLRLKMRSPSRVERLWYRYLHMSPPIATSGGRRSEAWARLVPYRWRAFHRRYATKHHYFWLPCILCNRPFGGHESGDSIPDPTGPTGVGVCICSQCTREGRGWRAPSLLEAIVDTIRDLYEHGHDEPMLDCEACKEADAEMRAAFAAYKDPET